MLSCLRLSDDGVPGAAALKACPSPGSISIGLITSGSTGSVGYGGTIGHQNRIGLNRALLVLSTHTPFAASH